MSNIEIEIKNAEMLGRADSIYATKFYVMQKQIDDLQQENQQLKRNCNIGNENLNFYREEYKKLENNWDKLKELIDVKLYNTEYLQKLCGCRIDDVDHLILKIIKNKMQELEQGVSDER